MHLVHTMFNNSKYFRIKRKMTEEQKVKSPKEMIRRMRLKLREQRLQRLSRLRLGSKPRIRKI